MIVEFPTHDDCLSSGVRPEVLDLRAEHGLHLAGYAALDGNLSKLAEDAAPFCRSGEKVGLPDEGSHLAGCGAVVELFGWGDLDDAPPEHHRDLVGEAQSLCLVVGNGERRSRRRF